MSENYTENGLEEQRARTFNPNEHVIQLKSKSGSADYLPVQWRLVWFREQCPHGTIETEEIEVDLDREMEEEGYAWNNEKRKSEKTVKKSKGYARYRAIVTDGKGGRATGTKSENAANFADFGEKAETGSIGRALAALGYGTQFTGDELNEGHRIVDSPVDRHNEDSAAQANSNGNHTNGATNATTAQPQAQNSNIPALIGSMKKRAMALGLCNDLATFKALLQEATGEVLDERDLTLDRIAKVNGHLTKVERQRKS